MKLTKKLICVATVAAMSLTSISALAAVPTPKDNTQAFIYAENYFNQGLYYEAMDELQFVFPIYSHEASKLAMWTHKVQDRITEWEVSEIFREVKRLYDANEVVAAYNYLHRNMQNYVNLSSSGVNNNPNVTVPFLVNNLTASEAAEYTSWVNLLNRGIITEAQAIVAVEDFVGDILWDPEMYYSVVPFGDGWDVYVKSVDSDHNIQAYHVRRGLREADSDDANLTLDTYYSGTAVDGIIYRERDEDVNFTAIDYNGNPASEYEWRYDSVGWETFGYPEALRANSTPGNIAGKAVRDENTTYVAD